MSQKYIYNPFTNKLDSVQKLEPEINIDTTNGRVGINTSGPAKALDVNSPTGDNLRLTYNDPNGGAVQYTDFILDNNGGLEIISTNKTVRITNPAFFAYSSGVQSNVTGDGTTYVVQFGTEQFDISNSFDTATGVFTAPITHRYLLNYSVGMTGLAATHTTLNIYFAVSNGSSTANYLNPANVRVVSSGAATLCGSYLIDMDAADTAAIRLNVGGSTKTVSVGSGRDIKFQGFMI